MIFLEKKTFLSLPFSFLSFKIALQSGKATKLNAVHANKLEASTLSV